MPLCPEPVLLWSVCGGGVQFKGWLKHDETRALAGGVYPSFLIPGVMSLIAQVSGENKFIWRTTFVIAGARGYVVQCA